MAAEARRRQAGSFLILFRTRGAPLEDVEAHGILWRNGILQDVFSERGKGPMKQEATY